VYLLLFILLLLILFPLCCIWHVLLSVGAIIMASKDTVISKLGTSGKRKDISLTVLQKLDIVE
jgi:hypothetical protein